VANNLLNARKHHPDHPSRPVIDWDLILQLEPMTMAGALMGADLNDLLPELVLVVLLLLLLSATAYKTLQNAHKLHEQESLVLLKEQETLLRSKQANLDDNPVIHAPTYGSTPSVSYDENSKSLLAGPSFGPDKVHQAWIDAVKLTVLFALVTAMNLLKGGPSEAGGGPLGLPVCGATCFWISEGTMLLVIVAFAVHVRASLLHRIRYGDAPVLSEIDWNEKNTITYPALAIAAGLVAGLFGVGGGILKGPIMLALGTCFCETSVY